MLSKQRELQVFLKSNVLFLIAIISIHFVQLKLLPGATIRPFTPIFSLMILMIFLVRHYQFRGRTFLTQSLLLRWFPLCVITLLYVMVTPLYEGDFKDALKFLISLSAAFLAYWMGYSALGMLPTRFNRLILITFVPIIIFSSIEIVGQFLAPIQDVINSFRSLILTYNIDHERLHLLFSEPSFMATYLLFFVYIVETSTIFGRGLKFFYLYIILMVILSGSLSVLSVMLTFLVLKLLKEGVIKFNLRFIFVFCLIFVLITFVFSNRIANFDGDVSIFIRMMNAFALWSMGTENYFLGSGFGGFTEYLSNYLGGVNLMGSSELQGIVDGTEKASQYSMLGQVFASMGILGLSSFLFMILRGKNRSSLVYVIPAMIAMLSALPWGLPYLWIMLGMIDRGKRGF